MAGRKPKPTALKLLAGNPGKRPLNDKEPKVTGDLTDAPDWFTESQKAGWDYALKNSPAGLLKRLDRSILAVWVVAEDTHRQATLALAKEGHTIFSPKTGAVQQNPWVLIQTKQAQLMIRSAADLGFTPSSRSKITVSGAEGDDDEDRFFGT